MKTTSKLLTKCALLCGLALVPAYAQQPTNPPPRTDPGTSTTAFDDQRDWGWIGLFGLIGLAGLFRRNPSERYSNLGSAAPSGSRG
jgi:hypothetical protein